MDNKGFLNDVSHNNSDDNVMTAIERDKNGKNIKNELNNYSLDPKNVESDNKILMENFHEIPLSENHGSNIPINPLATHGNTGQPLSNDTIPRERIRIDAIVPSEHKSALGKLILSSLSTSLNVANKCMSHSIQRVEKNLKHRVRDAKSYEHISRPKKWWEFVLLFSILIGVEFIHAVEAIFVNPILLAIGIPATFASMIWSLSPVLGLITVPILGSLSDKCSSKWGRRRPFIFFFTMGMIIGLILIGFGPNFSVKLGDAELKEAKNSHAVMTSPTTNTSSEYPFHVGIDTEAKRTQPHPLSYKYLLIFICAGVVIMDYSADSGSSPALSYMLDITLSEQHTLGLTIGTAMTGTGGLLGYLVGALDWESYWHSPVLRNQFQIVFMIALALLIVTATLTLTSFREMPLYHVNVDKAEYASRMARSKSLLYASDRSIKRKYSVRTRPYAHSISYLPSPPLFGDMSDLKGAKLPKGYRASLPNISSKKKSFFDQKAPRISIFRKKPASQVSPIVPNGNVLPQETPSKAVPLTPIVIRIQDEDGKSLAPITEFGENLDHPIGNESQSTFPSNERPGIRKTPKSSKNSSRSNSPSPRHRYKTSFSSVISHTKFQDLILDKGINHSRLSITGGTNPLSDTSRKSSLSSRISADTPKSKDDMMIGSSLDKKQTPYTNPLTLSGVDSGELAMGPVLKETSKTDGQNLQQISPILLNNVPASIESRESQSNSPSLTNTTTDEEDDMSLKEYLISIVKMPRILAFLCATHLFCWMAFLCFATYFSDFVGQSVFRGSPTANPGTPENLLYEAGVRFSCVGMFVYATTCILYSTRIKPFALRIGTKKVYMFGIAFYAVSMAILAAAPYKASVVILSSATGIIQATILSVPFIFVSLYHEQDIFRSEHQKADRKRVQKLEDSNEPNSAAIVYKKRGTGTDVAIVSSMVFWAQLTISLTMGKLIDVFDSTLVIPLYGCAHALIALAISFFIKNA